MADRSCGSRSSTRASGLARSLRPRRARALSIAAHLCGVATVVHVTPPAAVVSAFVDEEPFAGVGSTFPNAREINLRTKELRGCARDVPQRPVKGELVGPLVGDDRSTLLETRVRPRDELFFLDRHEVGRVGTRIRGERIEDAPDRFAQSDCSA